MITYRRCPQSADLCVGRKAFIAALSGPGSGLQLSGGPSHPTGPLFVPALRARASG